MPKALVLMDFARPVQTIYGAKVRILCTDGPLQSHPVVGFVEEYMVRFWNSEGYCNQSSNYNLIYVPPPKKTATRWLMMFASGAVHTTFDRPIFKVGDVIECGTIIALKKVTITEGEDL